MNKVSHNQTINKILMTARFIDGFWDRWIVHGVYPNDLKRIRPTLITKEAWTNGWCELANEKIARAVDLEQKGKLIEAETEYRSAGLYFQLAQWLILERNNEKLKWFNMGQNAFHIADQISGIRTVYEARMIDGIKCFGRVRIPANPYGVVVFINPFDSAKEELFTYEMDYVAKGYITVSFDGPGQGQTYVSQGLKATYSLWKSFVDEVISYAHMEFPDQKIYLFGTSSGAAWALYGSCSPLVTKAVAVSPAFNNDEIQLPEYFMERVEGLTEGGTNIIPDYRKLIYRNPVFLVHGNKDVMVTDQNIHDLYDLLPAGKKLLEYNDEGHCCNYKLPEIRAKSIKWFHEGEGETA